MRFIDACNNKKTDKVPIWLMRQAGRYMPEYLALKAKYTFWEMCRKPELMTEVTMQPINAFDLDAAIMFSDILIFMNEMGAEVEFNPGPTFKAAIRSQKQINDLKVDGVESEIEFVYQGIRQIKKELTRFDKPLIGFSGSPFTLASYMVEGGHSKSFSCFKSLMYQNHNLYELLMQKLTKVVIAYLKKQVEAGVDAIQIFDTWAGILDQQDYEIYVLPYIKEIVSEIQKTKIPVIYFIGNGAHLIKQHQLSGADVLGIDWRISIAEARKSLGEKVVLQGNLDPMLLLGPKDLLIKRTKEILTMNSGNPGFIFNCGHGLVPETPIENVKTLIETVHSFNG